MKKQKLIKGNFYVIEMPGGDKLVIIDRKEDYWIGLNLKRERIKSFYKNTRLNPEQALNKSNKEILSFKKIIKELELNAADTRGEETKNIRIFEKNIENIQKFKTKYIFQQPPEE